MTQGVFIMNKIIVQTSTREKRIATLIDEKIEHLVIEQPEQRSQVGDIYFGIVRDVIPGMNAAFIDIGGEKAGYLHRNKLPAYLRDKHIGEVTRPPSIENILHEGQKIFVQVEKDATNSKGPRLTGIIEWEGESLIYLPEGFYVAVSKKLPEETRVWWRTFGTEIKKEEEGIIFRTNCATVAKEKVYEELQRLRQQHANLIQSAGQYKRPVLVLERDTFFQRIVSEINRVGGGEVIVDELTLKQQLEHYYHEQPTLHFTFGSHYKNIAERDKIDREVEKSLKRIIWLDHGAYLVIEETEAATVIDVNTGKFVGKSNQQQTIWKTNQMAIKAIAREVRVRNIAGIILIDLIDMKAEANKLAILKLAREQFATDPMRTNVIGFTPLGILEITRKKEKVSLLESLTETCVTCHGTGRVMSAETLAFQLERRLWEYRFTEHEAMLIEATEDVIRIFSGEKDVHKQRLEEVLKMNIYFTVKEKEKPSYAIRQFGTKMEIEEKLDL